MGVAAHIKRAWNAWWDDEERASLSAWCMHGLMCMAAFSLVVALFNHLELAARNAVVTGEQPAVQSGANKHDPLIAQAAADHMPPDWDWRLLKAMVQKESNYNERAESPGGAVGLCQMLPSTARHLGLNSTQFFDPAANLDAGTRYLRDMYDSHFDVADVGPDWERTRIAIACYNAGPGRVRAAVRDAGSKRWRALAPHLPSSTVHHVEKIIEEFYPSFSAIEQPAGRPPIGNWKPKLRFWRKELL